MQSGGFAATPVVMVADPEQRPKKDRKKKKLTKKTKRKALKRSVDEFPEFVLHKEEDSALEASKPIDIVQPDSASASEHDIHKIPNIFDNNSYFERLAENFIDDRENSSTSDESGGSARLPSSLDGANKMREQLEALKKDGGDQWLIILNNYLESTPSKGGSPASYNTLQKALDDLENKDHHHRYNNASQPSKSAELDDEAEQFLQKARERNRRKFQDRQEQQLYTMAEAEKINLLGMKQRSRAGGINAACPPREDSNTPTSSFETGSETSTILSRPPRAQKTKIKKVKHIGKPQRKTILPPPKIIRVNETQSSSDEDCSAESPHRETVADQTLLKTRNDSETNQTDSEKLYDKIEQDIGLTDSRSRRTTVKSSEIKAILEQQQRLEKQQIRLESDPAVDKIEYYEEERGDSVSNNDIQTSEEDTTTSSVTPPMSLNISENSMLIEKLLSKTDDNSPKSQVDNTSPDSSSSRDHEIRAETLEIHNVDPFEAENLHNIDIDRLLEKDEDDIDLEDLDMQIQPEGPLVVNADTIVSDPKSKLQDSETLQHDFSAFAHLTPHFEEIMTYVVSPTYMDEQRNGEALDVQGDHWQLHTALNVFLNKEIEELHTVIYCNCRISTEKKKSPHFPVYSEKSIAIVFSNHRLYLLNDNKDQDHPLSTLSHIEYEAIRHIHVGLHFQCLRLDIQHEHEQTQSILLLPRDTGTSMIIIQQVIRHLPDPQICKITHYNDEYMSIWARLISEASSLYDSDDDGDDFDFLDDDDDDTKSESSGEGKKHSSAALEGYFMVFVKSDKDTPVETIVPEETFPSRVVGPLSPHALCFTEKHIFICEENLDAWPSNLADADHSKSYLTILEREMMSDLSYVEVRSNDPTGCELVMVFDRDSDSTSCTWKLVLQQSSTREIVISKLSSIWNKLFGIEISVRRPIESNVVEDGPSSENDAKSQEHLRSKPAAILGRSRSMARISANHSFNSLPRGISSMFTGRAKQTSTTTTIRDTSQSFK